MTVIPKTPRVRQGGDPPLRLAHVLFVLWVAGAVAWAFHAARLAYHWGWWESDPVLAAGLILMPVVLAHVLALYVIRLTGNPRFRS